MPHIDPNAPLPAGTVLFVCGLPGSGRHAFARGLSEAQERSGSRLRLLDGDDAQNVATAAALADASHCLVALIQSVPTLPSALERLSELEWRAPAGISVRIALVEVHPDGRKVVRMLPA